MRIAEKDYRELCSRPRLGAVSSLTRRRALVGLVPDIPVDSVGREDIERAVHALYEKIGEGNRQRRPGAAAARLLQQRISTVLEYASECGWRPENSRSRWSMVAEHAHGESGAHHSALLPPADAALIVEAIKRLRASDSVSARFWSSSP
jgi:hypothetical protein